MEPTGFRIEQGLSATTGTACPGSGDLLETAAGEVASMTVSVSKVRAAL